MKKIVLGILIILSSSMVYGQNSSSKSKAIDALFVQNQTKSGTEQIMLGLIKQYMSKKPNAPKSLEQEIQNSLDYKGYMTKVKAAYDKAYTEEEIKELTQLHQSENMELYKQKSERVAKALYDIGSAFGRESVKIITAKLQPY